MTDSLIRYNLMWFINSFDYLKHDYIFLAMLLSFSLATDEHYNGYSIQKIEPAQCTENKIILQPLLQPVTGHRKQSQKN